MKASGLALLVCMLLAQPARGQTTEPSDAELEQARGDFSEATQLEAHADWKGASVKLRSALSVKETPGLRYHLAHCEEQLGALLQASLDYERAAELIRDGAAAPDVETLLTLAQRRLDSRLAKLEIVVPTGTSAVAELDGRLLPPSAIGAAVKIDPGVHRLLVRAPGHRDYRAELTFVTGERRTLKVFFPGESPAGVESPGVMPAPLAAPAPAVPSARAAAPGVPPPAPSDRARPAGLGAREAVMIGEGALVLGGLGVGIGFAFARHGASQRVDLAQLEVDAASASNPSACASAPAPPACAKLTQAIDEHRRAATIETIGFVGAGAAGALLAATWLWWPAPHGVQVLLHPRASGALVVAGGRF